MTRLALVGFLVVHGLDSDLGVACKVLQSRTNGNVPTILVVDP